MEYPPPDRFKKGLLHGKDPLSFLRGGDVVLLVSNKKGLFYWPEGDPFSSVFILCKRSREYYPGLVFVLPILLFNFPIYESNARF